MRRSASFFECLHVALWTVAEACLSSTEDRHPKYTPINKVEPMRRIWEQEFTLFGRLKSAVGLAKPVDEDTFAE